VTPRRARRGGVTARRRLLALVGVAALTVVAYAVLAPTVKRVLREFTYPLHDTAIIRQQAQANHLDPALVAAVIYAETKFDARTSSAGALGLMQILPSTARYLAHLSGGTTFRIADLAEPRVNIAYGSYYLRFLFDRYGGDETLALAAYNAGATNVNTWVAAAHAKGQTLSAGSIPFPQTRAYVEKVEAAEVTYRKDYGL
jgi:soluble lytic murein transglycosylase